MTDLLLDGRVIPIPPGWRVRVTLECIADDAHPVTTPGGTAAYSAKRHNLGPQDAEHGGARPAGTEQLPGIDELEPLPLLRKKPVPNGATPSGAVPGVGARPGMRPIRSGVRNGKLCPTCHLRVGPRTQVCLCGHRFPVVKS